MTAGSLHNSDHLAKKPWLSTVSPVAWVLSAYEHSCGLARCLKGCDCSCPWYTIYYTLLGWLDDTGNQATAGLRILSTSRPWRADHLLLVDPSGSLPSGPDRSRGQQKILLLEKQGQLDDMLDSQQHCSGVSQAFTLEQFKVWGMLLRNFSSFRATPFEVAVLFNRIVSRTVWTLDNLFFLWQVVDLDSLQSGGWGL